MPKYYPLTWWKTKGELNGIFNQRKKYDTKKHETIWLVKNNNYAVGIPIEEAKNFMVEKKVRTKEVYNVKLCSIQNETYVLK